MAHSVKGRGFATLSTLGEAKGKFLRLVPRGPLGTERVALGQACGRVLAAPVRASGPVPPFSRAAMDGFAVRARDTFGASPTNPLTLQLAGEVHIGKVSRLRLQDRTFFSETTGRAWRSESSRTG